MEFLDSIELASSQNKSHRMRSWYLYEQYKSLEKNQIDAALKLKEKSLQDRLLHQELSERRARRRLGVRHQRTPNTVHISTTDLQCCFTDENLFESLCGDSKTSDEPKNTPDSINCISPSSGSYKSPSRNCLYPEVVSFDHRSEPYEDETLSRNSSINSVNVNLKTNPISSSNLADDDVKEQLELVRKSLEEFLSQKLETVIESQRWQERSPSLDDPSEESAQGDSDDEDNSLSSSCCCGTPSRREVSPHNTNNIYALWSKLVSYAYQIIQLNHGNILQPFVSPIKFATDLSAPSSIQKKLSKLSSSLKCSKNSHSVASSHTNVGSSNPGVNETYVESLSDTIGGDKTCNIDCRLECSDYEVPRNMHPANPHLGYNCFVCSNENSSLECPDVNNCSEQTSGYQNPVTNPMLQIASYIDGYYQIAGENSM